MSEYQRHKCFCCNRLIEVEAEDNPMIIGPAYNGLVFRSFGNFGSTFFDPGPDTKGQACLQILVCDECLHKKIRKVGHLKDITTTTTAELQQLGEAKDVKG